jgi:hypothetical protein
LACHQHALLALFASHKLGSIFDEPGALVAQAFSHSIL